MVIAYFDADIDPSLCHEIDYESLADLFCLSHTCRHLRQLTLPKVWKSVEIVTVRQLGALRELLKAVPSIAPLIKSFRFFWTMDGDCLYGRLTAFRNVRDSLLELAFRNRLQLWSDIMRQHGSEFRLNKGGSELYREGDHCLPPGDELSSRAWKNVAQQGVAAYDWLSKRGGKGPDGDGEDVRVKSAADFVQCITEVVSMLSRLQTFGWETHVTPMPEGVFAVLKQLGTLKDLRLVLSNYHRNLSDCEYGLLSCCRVSRS